MTGPKANLTLTDDEVRKVAGLSKLAVLDADLADVRGRLEAVLGYVECLRELSRRSQTEVKLLDSAVALAGWILLVRRPALSICADVHSCLRNT